MNGVRQQEAATDIDQYQNYVPDGGVNHWQHCFKQQLLSGVTIHLQGKANFAKLLIFYRNYLWNAKEIKRLFVKNIEQKKLEKKKVFIKKLRKMCSCTVAYTCNATKINEL